MTYPSGTKSGRVAIIWPNFTKVGPSSSITRTSRSGAGVGRSSASPVLPVSRLSRGT
ncbi:MAG: hypothetical protein ACYTGB_02850 [Planctomycetota bacterium]